MSKVNEKSYQQQRKSEKNRAIADKINQAIETKLSIRSFAERYYSLYQSATFFKDLLQLVSGTTAVVALYYLLPDFIFIIKMALIITAVAVFEAKAKRPATDNFFKTSLVDEYEFETSSLLLGLAVIGISAGLSIYGTIQTTTLFFPDIDNTEPVLLDKKEVKQFYALKLAQVDTAESSYIAMREYRGRLRTQDIEALGDYANDKRNWEQKQLEALQVLADSNKAITAAHKANHEEMQEARIQEREAWKQKLVTGIILCEMLFLLCIWFGYYYAIEVARETKLKPTENVNEKDAVAELIKASQRQQQTGKFGLNADIDSSVPTAKQSIQIPQGKANDQSGINGVPNANANANGGNASPKTTIQIPQIANTPKSKNKRTTPVLVVGTIAQCSNCGRDYKVTRKGHEYCNGKCRSKAYHNRNPKQEA